MGERGPRGAASLRCAVTHLQRIGIALALVVSAGAVTYAVLFDESVPFLVGDPEAPWIGPPMPVDTSLHRVAPGHRIGATFERRFEMPAEGTLQLEARALGALSIAIDDAAVPLDDGRRGPAAPEDAELSGARCLKRRCRGTVALAPGPHWLRARVVNERGPPLLSLALAPREGGAPTAPVDTSSGFRVRAADGVPLAAVRAEDARRYAGALAGTRPLDALARTWPWLLALALFGAAAPLLRTALPDDAATRSWIAKRRLRALGVLLLLFWSWLFVGRFSEVPLESGFDAFGHLEYVQYVAERGELPARDHGWSTYHPPLFYAIAAMPVRLAGARFSESTSEAERPAATSEGIRDRLAFRFAPWLLALATLVVIARLAQLTFPDDPRIAVAATAFAGLLPLQITTACYVSNENTHAFFAALALLMAGHAMLDEDARRRAIALAATAAALGAALLSKFTGLLVAAVVCAFVAFERWQARDESLPLAGLRGLAVGAGAALIGGWFYLQSWLRFGDPIVWNLDYPGHDSWWVHPAFHTRRYFTQAGDAFSFPFFSSFASFWDGLYTTFWGDGQLGGFASWAGRPQAWDYDWMAIGYLLALPLTIVVAWGGLALVRDSLRGRDRSRRALLAMLTTLGFGLGVSVVSAVLRYPFFGTARASYVLAVLAPVSLAAGRGIVATQDAIAARGAAAPALAALFRAWLTCAVGAVVFSYAL